LRSRSNALFDRKGRIVGHHHSNRFGSGAPLADPRRTYRVTALVSILGILWLWQDTGDAERSAAHAQSTFWYVLPTLPMFLLMPAMLRHGIGFWLTLAACCALTFILYLCIIHALEEFGVTL
jgi:hypothetical protein